MSMVESTNLRKRRRYVERLIREGFRLPKNRAIFKMFAGYLKQNGLKVTTIYHYARALEDLDAFTRKAFDEVTKQDLMEFFNSFGNRYKPRTINDYKVCLKRFYKWLLGNDEEYPPLVKWIKKANNLRQKVERSDLITEDEFKAMLRAADSQRDRCLLWLLWETGARVGEIVSIRLRDVELRGEMALITLRGKTGSRTVPVIAGFPDLQAWLNQHPFRNDPDAPLFISYKKGSFGKPLLEGGVAKIVKRLASKAEIKKHVYPHLFRHSRATQLSTRLRESVLKEMFGWSQTSKMPAVYLHLAGADVINSYGELYGLKTEEKPEEKFKPKKCPRCGAINPFDAVYCSRCGLILDEVVAAKIAQKQKELNEKLEFIMKAEKDIMELREKIIGFKFFEEVLRSVINGEKITEEQKKILKRLISSSSA